MAGIASFITICGLPYLIWASVTCGKRLDKYGRSINKWVALAHAFVLYVLIAITLFYSMRFGVLLVQNPDWEGPADVWLSLLFAVLAAFARREPMSRALKEYLVQKYLEGMI